MATNKKEKTAMVLPDIVAKCFTKTGDIKLPLLLPACADVLYVAREERYKLQHQVTALAELETKLEEKFKEELPKQAATTTGGTVGKVELMPKVKPVVENWDKFYAFIRKTNSFEFLQRRLNEGAAREFAEANKRRVPGTNVLHYTDVSCTAVRRG